MCNRLAVKPYFTKFRIRKGNGGSLIWSRFKPEITFTLGLNQLQMRLLLFS